MVATFLLAAAPADTAHADTPHRAVPDYDSRPAPSADATDALLWVPRIITGPLYLVWQYLIRTPLIGLDTWVEQNDVVPLLYSLFTFGPERKLTVVPTLFYDFGFLPSVGLYGAWNDLGARGHRLSVHAATWGDQWLSLSIQDRARVDPWVTLVTRAHAIKRPDYLLGFEDSGNGHHAATRYGAEHVDAELGWEVRVAPRSLLAVSGYVASASFGETYYNASSEPSVLRYVADHGGPLPVAFAQGYSLASIRGSATWDTRDPRGIPSSGVRLEGRGELASTFAGIPGSRWLRLDGEALAGYDVFGAHRVISVAVDAAAMLPFDGSPIPFDQTIDVGGFGPLPAFLPGDLRGLSAVAATLSYDWPIWVFLNARLYVAAGNAFGERFDGFAMRLMRFSFGLSIRPSVPGDHPFEAGVSLGTEPIAAGATIDSVRFFVGGRNLL